MYRLGQSDLQNSMTKYLMSHNVLVRKSRNGFVEKNWMFLGGDVWLVVNTYRGLGAVGSLESSWALGLWKFGSSSPGWTCLVHHLSSTLIVSIGKGL